MNLPLFEQLVKWPAHIISGADLRAILPKSENARKAIIKRTVQEGYLQSLKRDYYLICRIPNKASLNTFELAQFIYGPSYVSLESALSYHGWIPERVTTTCSATIKQARSFSTPIGEFSFEKVPNTSFPQGVYFLKQDHARFLMADPWKAIADMIYCRKKNWASIHDIMSDLRIEEDNVQHHPLTLLAELSDIYPHKRTQKILQTIHRELTT